ncbi:hypothetical protein [Xenorhabdus ehlersii]|uniref:Uncharacterized protein n=1 Tax=Xenorhabdus ehlersii TaxID=290111 RepID=A0A2D0INH4_9GAMM|nr:hypothetical protein [Xenorhabdus ehlersii]PHM23360.1 hypothetical protein Xehl_02889 [Xenorhabdus ehlersii]RKE93375.1 hypothetical protein BDE27_1113 [Xenorhabdus ehlersii]
MSQPITIHQASEKAQQLEFINQLIESYPHRIESRELSLISSLMAKLSGDVAVFLIEAIAGEEDGCMKKIKINPGITASVSDVKHINEEIQAQMIPLLTAVENQADSDTYHMLRGIKRLMTVQFNEINKLSEVLA